MLLDPRVLPQSLLASLLRTIYASESAGDVTASKKVMSLLLVFRFRRHFPSETVVCHLPFARRPTPDVRSNSDFNAPPAAAYLSAGDGEGGGERFDFDFALTAISDFDFALTATATAIAILTISMEGSKLMARLTATRASRLRGYKFKASSLQLTRSFPRRRMPVMLRLTTLHIDV